tara:strand:- start:748 stop:1239 length:492 start_codon:yes stop_codon:yes gene_type:complete
MIEKERKSVDYLVVNELKKQSLTISLAESCTGGKIASLMTSRSGASSYFKGGLVCYSKSSKVNILNIPKDLIESVGSVSKEVAREMAISAKLLFNSNIAISITGNAGPTRGDLKKKIGTVFIGIAKYSEVMVHKFSFSGDRDKIIKNTVEQSFKLIYRELIKE